MTFNILFYIFGTAFIGFYVYMFAFKKRKIKESNRKQWRFIKNRFMFCTLWDEQELYRAYCDQLPKHWFLGKVYPEYYKDKK